MLKQTLLLTTTIWAAALLSISQPAYAQISEFKLLPSDGAAGDHFGVSVSISGDYVVVGAAGGADNGFNSGSAYVFKRSGTNWGQEAKLIPSDGTAFDSFGRSVSISGDYAVMGAPGDDDNGGGSGSAYLFKSTGTSWAQEAKLLPSDGAVEDFFGFSVSISGDYAAVGADGDDDNGSDAGSAYVFKRTGTSWAQEAKYLPSDGAADDLFGHSVSISGDYVVVGAPGNDDLGNSSGSAYVFKRTDTSWAQEAKLLPLDGAVEEGFGFSVSISGDYAFVGAFQDDDNGTDAGSAYLFKRTGTNWVEEAKLLPSDGAAFDWFGYSVSISADYAVVGASLDDDNGTDAGSAYLFKRSDTSWAQEPKLLPSNGAAIDWFGFSVSISGDYAVVGAFLDDDNGDGSGSAYVYSGVVVGIDDERAGLPAEFSLSQNYPNPFNPSTVIRYALPKSSDVSLVIYNLMGQEVMRWEEKDVSPGNHEKRWEGTTGAGFQVSSGMYIYRILVGDFAQTRKMVLLK